MMLQSATSGMAVLEAELQHWQEAGHRPRLFLRDDDAISDTPALRRLIGLCEQHNVPLLLAAIPRDADASLGKLVRNAPLVTGAVHGYAHIDHTRPGQKVCELGTDRPLETVLAELVLGRDRLLELFGEPPSALLVPPWNRIHEPVLAAIGRAGFGGVSRHGWPGGPAPAGLVEINTHVDIMHWSGGTIGRESDWVVGELAANLAIARKQDWQAVGVLTHHLDHDDQAWAVLEACFQFFDGDTADWIGADTLL